MSLLGDIKDAAMEILLWYKSSNAPQSKLTERLTAALVPIYGKQFEQGKKQVDGFMRKEFIDANKKYDKKLKYDKDVLMKFNDKNSIFNGYYDTAYADTYTKSEIDAIKRKILSAKYSDLPESDAIQLIQSAADVSDQKAQLLWRYQKAQLDTTAHQIYFEDGLSKDYDKVWRSKDDARPDHKRMDGKIADADGYFDTPAGKCFGAPYPGSFNCRCTVEFVKKTKGK